MLSIKLKIILAYTVVFGIVLTFFAAIIYHSTKRASFLRLNTNLKSYSISLRNKIEDELNDHSAPDVATLASIHAKDLIDKRFQLFNQSGKVILKDSILGQANVPNLTNVLHESFKYSRKKIDHHWYHILWSRFETGNDSVYILETAASVKDVVDDLDRLFYLFWIIIPGCLFITDVAAFFISKAAFRPITHMADTAKNISGENLDKRLKLSKANDEVRALGETLNEMIGRIDDAFKSQKRFIANASHEIKTPLTILQTELEILQKRVKDSDSRESIKNALSEIESLTKLTNSLLTIVRLDASKTKLRLSRIRIDELLADCVQTMTPAATARDIQLNLSIEDPTEIQGDKEKLKSVFLNLIENAIKYSFAGSSVYIKLQNDESGNYLIRVENTGPGINPADIPYIFNRFYRSNEIRAEIDGSGLGLAIAKEVVELHRGTITVESKAGETTCFRVTLPRTSS